MPTEKRLRQSIFELHEYGCLFLTYGRLVSLRGPFETEFLQSPEPYARTPNESGSRQKPITLVTAEG